MPRTFSRGSIAALGVALACIATDAYAYSTSRCSITKSQAMSKALVCLISKQTRILAGRPATMGSCTERLQKAFDRADSRGGCAPSGDAPAAIARVEGFAAAVLDDLHADLATSDDALDCLSAKVRQLGTFSRCDAEALAVRLHGDYLGLSDDFGLCRVHVEQKFTSLEAELTCASVGDVGAATNRIAGGYGYLPGADFSYVDASLSGVDLPYADLQGSRLWMTSMTSSNFRNADLSDAIMRLAYVIYSDLTGAVFTGADMEAATLDHCLIEGAELAAANLGELRACSLTGCPANLPADWKCQAGCLVGPRVDLQYRDLSGANFDGVNVTDAYGNRATFTDSSWIGANLTNASFQQAIFSGADLSSADLTSISMRYAQFVGAVLEGANLTDAYLEDAYLAGSDLDGADMTGAYFYNTDIEGASLVGVTWAHTMCPDGTNSDDNSGTCCGHHKFAPPSACSP